MSCKCTLTRHTSTGRYAQSTITSIRDWTRYFHIINLNECKRAFQDTRRDEFVMRFIWTQRTAKISFHTQLPRSDFIPLAEGLSCCQHARLTRLTEGYKLELDAILLVILMRIISHAARFAECSARFIGVIQLLRHSVFVCSFGSL